MSLAKLAGFDVITLRLDVPRVGAWTALTELDTGDDAAPSGRVSLVLATSPAVTYSGSIVAPTGTNSPTPGRSRVLLVAGAAGMSAALVGKPYASIAPALVVEDIITAAGETRGDVPNALSTLPTQRLWLRPKGLASTALSRFLAGSGLIWRMSPSGAVAIVAESWPTYSGDFIVEREPNEHGRSVLALEAADLLPGTTISGKRVDRVVHCIGSDGKYRTEVTYL